MIVEDIQVNSTADAQLLTATVRSEVISRQAQIHYRISGLIPESVVPLGDPFVAALVPSAMALGEDLRIEGAVSPKLLRACAPIMDVFSTWWPKLRPVRIDAVEQLFDGNASGAGAFFSCGVDSFYTLLKNLTHAEVDRRDRVTHLVYIHGFDTREENRALFESIRERFLKVAAETGTTPVTVESNLRTFSDPLVHSAIQQGPYLASVGLALSGSLQTCYIPSSHSYRDLTRCGTNPITDPLWSTETLTFLHDGAELRRLGKVERLAGWPLALENLIVCRSWDRDRPNCCACSKCRFTQLLLLAFGVLGSATPTFSPSIDPNVIARARIRKEHRGIFRELLSRFPPDVDRDVVVACRKALRRSWARDAVRPLYRRLPRRLAGS